MGLEKQGYFTPHRDERLEYSKAKETLALTQDAHTTYVAFIGILKVSSHAMSASPWHLAVSPTTVLTVIVYK